MGYTHYWSLKAAVRPEIRQPIADAVNAIITKVRERGISLADGNGEEGSEPQIDAEAVYFNGVGPKAHETFGIEFDAPTEFDFCKTARKPYDLAVTATLVILKQFLGADISVRSDGDIGDWKAGGELAAEVLGRSFDFDLDTER